MTDHSHRKLLNAMRTSKKPKTKEAEENYFNNCLSDIDRQKLKKNGRS